MEQVSGWPLGFVVPPGEGPFRLTSLPPLWQLELKKTLLDRMVHLLSRGYVLPVVSYIRKCLEKLDTDISLIRYFVTEVSSPPSVSPFVLFTRAGPFMAQFSSYCA